MSASPQKRTKSAGLGDVRLVPKGDIRTAAKALLFDHLVGAGEQRRRHFEAELPRRLEVDHELELDPLLHRQVGCFVDVASMSGLLPKADLGDSSRHVA